MGFPLSVGKAQRGPAVTWIGCQLQVTNAAVTVRIDASKVDELRTTTDELLASNIVAVKKLGRYAGVANHFTSVLYVWRPFLAELWSAIQSAGTNRPRGAPLKCAWRTQILTALVWIRAFLREKVGAIQMCYRADAHQNSGRLVRIVGGGSIYGIGSYLVVGDDIAEWYASTFHKFELGYLQLEAGDNAHQQVFEALNLLVALGLWLKH